MGKRNVWLLIVTAIILIESPDPSASQRIYASPVAVLCAARSGGSLVIGLETSVQRIDLSSGLVTQAGLEEHRTTAVAIDSEFVWAGTISIYNPSTPILYRTPTELPSDWQSMGTLPSGSGHMRRLIRDPYGLIVVTGAHIWRWDEDPLDVTPDSGTLVDCRWSGTGLVCILNQASGPSLWTTDADQWVFRALPPELSEVTAFDTADGVYLVVDGSGTCWRVEDGSARLLVRSESPVVGLQWNGEVALLAHPNGLSWLDAEGVQRTLVPSDPLLATPNLMDDPDGFYFSCHPRQPFQPVACTGLYRWSPSGGLDQGQMVDALSWLPRPLP